MLNEGGFVNINESEVSILGYGNVFYKMFVNSPNIVLLADEDGKLILANRMFYRIVKDEIVDKNIFDIFNFNKDEITTHLKKNEELFIEKFIYNKYGKELWLKIHFYLVKHKERRFLTAILNDITDIVEMTRRIDDDEMMLSNILNGVEDFICMTDLGGTITYLNSSAERILGFKKEEMIGKKLSEYFHQDELEEAKKEFQNLLDGKGVIDKRKFRLLNSNGEYIWFEFIHSSLIEENNVKVGTILICREITEKIRMEHENKKIAQELEYERLKSEFLANVSHELKTPLNVIYGIVQLMEMFKNKNETTEFVNNFDKFFPILKQNTYRLLRLTNNIVDLTKADAGFLTLNAENVDIVYLVEEICNSTRNYLSSKNIELIFNTEVEEKVIACDTNKIERVILNLLSNAVKFSNNNGRIEVDIREIPGKVQLTISDNGIGIPKEMLNEVFDRFKLVDTTLTRENEGSGIGLSLVKEFIDLHAGTIEVESTVGLGTKFIITLPDITLEDESAASYSEKNYLEQVHVEFSDLSK
ncbi:Sensor protein kinase WalK [Caloramator mitchellensis]|uniref:histidine kinase n=1 Tax=Caloramator mitchellensis TaxID=908809 RepID=A0A0R3JUW2_CALMK|nr:Sensor protein kinase WalK [Caloramator mitchellensis]